MSVYQARPILEARAKGAPGIVTTGDLGRSKTRVALTDAGVEFPDGTTVAWDEIDRIAKEEHRVFTITEGGPVPVHNYSETTGWARTLCPSPSAPTALVSGIPMHRIKGTDPLKDTESKLKALGQPRGRVLDTATGLGYTAIYAARTAKGVVTIELDPAGLEIARLNPWSRELFERPNIRQIIGDAYECIGDLPAGYFDDVIHDPPTMTLAGELYSEEFYRRLHHVMKLNGRLFHYIGDPDSGLGKRYYPGIMGRLGRAGFSGVTRKPEAFGVTAIA